MKQTWDKHCVAINEVNEQIEFLFEQIGNSTRNYKAKAALKKKWTQLVKSTKSMDQFISPIKSIPVKGPWTQDKFMTVWQFWKDYLNEQHGFIMRSRMEVKQLEMLVEYSANNPDTAIRILNTAMAGGYKSIFKLKEEPEEEIKGKSEFNLSDYE